MGYLEKLQKVKVGDTVFIKCRDFPPSTHKIISIKNDVATLDCDGDDNSPWKFSIKTSDALTAPFAYWISTEKGNRT